MTTPNDHMPPGWCCQDGDDAGIGDTDELARLEAADTTEADRG